MMCFVASDRRLGVHGKSCVRTLSPWNGLTVTEGSGLSLTPCFEIMILCCFFNRITSKPETPINYIKPVSV